MFQDICVALIGFTGEYILEGDDGFYVRAGLDLNPGELEQITSIIRLGWFYQKFSEVVSSNDLCSIESFEKSDIFLYFTSMVISISDILNEYVEDVANLEQMMLHDRFVPLSRFSQHLQKVFFISLVLFNSFVSASTLLSFQRCMIYCNKFKFKSFMVVKFFNTWPILKLVSLF
jgi:hypothetical protein